MKCTILFALLALATCNALPVNPEQVTLRKGAVAVSTGSEGAYAVASSTGAGSYGAGWGSGAGHGAYSSTSGGQTSQTVQGQFGDTSYSSSVSPAGDSAGSEAGHYGYVSKETPDGVYYYPYYAKGSYYYYYPPYFFKRVEVSANTAKSVVPPVSSLTGEWLNYMDDLASSQLFYVNQVLANVASVLNAAKGLGYYFY